MLQYGIVYYRARHRRNDRSPVTRLAWMVVAGLAGLLMVGWGLWLLRSCHGG